jgi:GNAT superfamily N-acetyltransferase
MGKERMDINRKVSFCEHVLEEKTDFSSAKRLYRSAFPKEERVPFGLLRLLALRKGIELVCYREGETFCGFTYTVTEGNVVFVLFFAVNEALRGQGYGSSILKFLRKKNPGRTVILNVEPLDPEAENAKERVRRVRFYEKNGFFDAGYDIDEIGGKFRVFATEKCIDVDAYLKVFGRMSFGFWKPKIVRVSK